MLKKQISPKLKRLIITVFFLVLAIIILLFVPPQNNGIIAFFLGIIAACSYSFFRFYLKKEYAFLAAFGIDLFLFTTMIVGFQIVNTILLISFIIGLAYLIAQ